MIGGDAQDPVFLRRGLRGGRGDGRLQSVHRISRDAPNTAFLRPTAPLGRLTLELYRKCSGRMVLRSWREGDAGAVSIEPLAVSRWRSRRLWGRSEEHTSELQS